MADEQRPILTGGEAPNQDNSAVDLTESLDQNEEYVFEPLGNLHVVRLHNSEKKSKGGIYIPENAVPKPNLATIVASGPGQRSGLNGTLIEPFCQPGDLVLVQPFGVTTVKFKGDQELSIISENDILIRIYTKGEEKAE